MTQRTLFWSLIALAAVLRFLTLGDRPFDGDEGVILKIAELPISELLQAVAVDVHPPLYHLLVHGSLSLFGVSEWSVRLVGVLAGIGLVALYPLLASALRVPGWILGLLLATSPYLVNLSQDARMYSLLVFLTAALWYVTYRLATDRSENWVWWIGWSILSLAIASTHHIGWLIIGLMVGLLVWSKVKGQLLKVAWSQPVVALTLLILGYLPLLSTTIAQVQGRLAEQSVSSGLSDTVSGVVGGLYRMLAGRTFLDINPAGLAELASTTPWAVAAFGFSLVIPIGVLVLGMFWNDRVSFTSQEVAEATSCEVSPSRLGWRQQGLMIICVSFILALLVGTIGTQASRYLSYLAPFIVGFLGLGCLVVWKTTWGKAAVLVVALTFLAGLTTQYLRHNQSAGVDVYAETIEAELKIGDAVVLRGGFAGGEERAFNFYRERCGDMPLCLKSDRGPLPFAVPITDIFADYDVRKSNLDELRSVDPAAKVVELLSQPDINRVWYFDNSYQQSILTNLPAGFVAKIVPLNSLDKEGKELQLTKVSKQ